MILKNEDGLHQSDMKLWEGSNMTYIHEHYYPVKHNICDETLFDFATKLSYTIKLFILF